MRSIAVRIAKITVAALLGVTLTSTTATAAMADEPVAGVDVSATVTGPIGDTWPWDLIKRA